MAITAEARIVVRGGAEALKTVAGVKRGTTEASSASKKAAREEEKAAKAAQQAKERAEKAKQRALHATERETKRAARAEQREAEKLAQHYQRLALQSANHRIRQEQRMTREAQREAQKRSRIEQEAADKRAKVNGENARRGRGALGAAVGGVVAGAGAAFGVARGVGGIRSIQERIQAANEFKERLTIVGSQAGLSAEERANVEGKVNTAAKATGRDQGELLGVLEVGQAKFNDLRFFADNLQQIATIARASGADAGEFAQALGYTKQAFGLTGEDAMEAARLMVAAASKGSIEVKDFASSFAPVAGLFAQSTGMKGLEGVRQFLGTSQAAGTLGKSADETATLVERFIAAIADPEVQKDLRQKAGVNIKNMTPQGIIESLSGSAKFAKPGVKQDIFKDVREQQAVTALISAYRRVQGNETGAVDIGAIASVDSKDGTDLINKTMQELEGSGALAFDRRNAELQEHTIQNLGKYNDQLLKVVDVSTRLETSFDSLALWSDAIAATGIGAALGGMAAGGGGGAAAGGGMMSSIGGAVGNFGVPGAILGAGIAASAAVYESGAGEGLGNWLYELLNDVPEKQAYRGMDPDRAPPTAGKGPALALTAPRPGTGPLNNKALDEVNRNLGMQTKLLSDIREGLKYRPAPLIDQSARNGARP